MDMSSTALVLDPGEIHVWWLDLGRVDARADFLSAGERARAARLHQARDRERWAASRAALRQILAGYLDEAPAAVPLDRSPAGKPVLAGASPLRFTLTHSGNRGALAVARAREVGIDLEERDAVREDAADLDRLTAVVCTPAEATRLARLPLSDRVDAFLALWTVKEAYLKALGAGLARDPRSLEVEVGADGRAALFDAAEPLLATPFQLLQLDAGQGWAAALAHAGGDALVREWTWP
jgi:4'-phosphopantetheinyl transferase